VRWLESGLGFHLRADGPQVGGVDGVEPGGLAFWIPLTCGWSAGRWGEKVRNGSRWLRSSQVSHLRAGGPQVGGLGVGKFGLKWLKWCRKSYLRAGGPQVGGVRCTPQ
jgi:hypothetical protein